MFSGFDAVLANEAVCKLPLFHFQRRSGWEARVIGSVLVFVDICIYVPKKDCSELRIGFT